jgi:cytochrome c oxidase subunit 5b
MFALRSRLIARQATRSFTTTRALLQAPKTTTAKDLADVHGTESLIGQGAKEGTFPTDLEQATGLERLELLAKLEGVEFFDTKPLDSSRTGTLADPILVESYDDYRYIGCTGAPADSHHILWLKPTVDQVARCWECGSVYKLKPVGVPQDDHHH